MAWFMGGRGGERARNLFFLSFSPLSLASLARLSLSPEPKAHHVDAWHPVGARLFQFGHGLFAQGMTGKRPLPSLSYLTRSVFEVVLQRSTPPQIHQLILHYD